MADEPEIMPISKAPMRVQREYYRRERRNSAIAIAIIVLVTSAVAYGIWRLVR